jgi:ketosteroid isomerase-like protein
MSEDNIAIARRAIQQYNAFMRGEISHDVYLELYDPQIEVRWHDRQTYPDTPQHLSGAKDFEAFNRQYRESWADLAAEFLELTEAPGDRVLAFVRQTALGRKSGVPIEIHYFQLWTFRDGRVIQIDFFRHRADALQAAGLPE